MSSYREERRADRLADRAADREDERARREEARRDAETRRALEAKDRQEAERARARRKKEKAEARRVRVEAARGWLSAEADTAFALVAMACAIGPAVYFQWHALESRVPLLIAVALAVMLESGAWVATVAGARAAREGRPAGVYRTAMWGAAAVSAAINLWHGSALYGPGIGVVLGLSSLGGVAFWELRCAGRHEDEKARRTKADRRAERERRRAEKTRREHHPKRAEAADRILSAAPVGSMTAEDAWLAADHPDVAEVAGRLLSAAPGLAFADAWRIGWEHVHDVATPGITAELVERRLTARELLAQTLIRPEADWYPDSPEDIRVMPLPDLSRVYVDGLPKALTDALMVPRTGGVEGGTRTPSRTSARAASAQVTPSEGPVRSVPRGAAAKRPKTGPGGAARVVRELAREEQVTASPTEREDARDWLAERLRTDQPVTWAEVREDFTSRWNRGRAWHGERLAEARDLVGARLHLVGEEAAR